MISLADAIARRRLAGEDRTCAARAAAAVLDDLPVAMDDVQDVEQLPLVLVDALDLHVEHRVRIDDDAGQLLRQLRQRELVAALDRLEAFEQEPASSTNSSSSPQLVEIADPAVADGARDQRRQRPIRVQQPAARRHAVRLVVEALGTELVEVRRERRLHQLRMQRGDAVDRMAADHGQVAPCAPAAIAVVDDRDALLHRRRRPESVARPRPGSAD